MCSKVQYLTSVPWTLWITLVKIRTKVQMDHQNELKLHREFGVVSAICLMVGTMVGSAIFISPSSILINSGSVGLSLIMWFIPGVLTLLVIFCFMELASIAPRAGAEYVYFRVAFGDIAGFLFAWTNALILLPAFYAILAMTATYYIMSYVDPECMSESGASVISVMLLVSIAALNTVYVKYTTRIQVLLTSMKVVALAIIIITGFVQICNGRTETLKTGFEGSILSAGSIASSIQVGIFSYFGWQGMFSVIEEVKTPKKTVPISIGVTMMLVSLLYIMTNVAYFTVMTPDEIIHSPAVAMTFADKTLGSFSVIIPLCVALSVIGTLNGSMLAGSRVFFAAGRDGLFPEIFASIHVKYRTPVPALVAKCLVAILYIMTDDSHLLINCQGIVLTINFILIATAVLSLKHNASHIKRPVSVPIAVPVLCLVLGVGLFVLGVHQQPFESLVVMGLIASGLPVYAIGVAWQKKPEAFTSVYTTVTLALQKTFMLAHTDGDFEVQY